MNAPGGRYSSNVGDSLTGSAFRNGGCWLSVTGTEAVDVDVEGGEGLGDVWNADFRMELEGASDFGSGADTGRGDDEVGFDFARLEDPADFGAAATAFEGDAEA